MPFANIPARTRKTSAIAAKSTWLNDAAIFYLSLEDPSVPCLVVHLMSHSPPARWLAQHGPNTLFSLGFLGSCLQLPEAPPNKVFVRQALGRKSHPRGGFCFLSLSSRHGRGSDNAHANGAMRGSMCRSSTHRPTPRAAPGHRGRGSWSSSAAPCKRGIRVAPHVEYSEFMRPGGPHGLSVELGHATLPRGSLSLQLILALEMRRLQGLAVSHAKVCVRPWGAAYRLGVSRSYRMQYGTKAARRRWRRV